MKINIFQWRYSTFLILPALWLCTSNAQAAATCTASLNAGSVSISNSLTPSNVNDESITATLEYNCKNTGGDRRYVSVCLGVDGGEYNSSNLYPRYLKSASSPNDLAFTMTLPGNTLWGTRSFGAGSEYNSGARSLQSGESFSGSVPINISLLSNNDNDLATPGVYTNNFGNGNRTAITVQDRIFSASSDCSSGGQGNGRFPFIVQATIIPSCKITTNPGTINLGSQPASKRDLSSNGKIGVTCTKTTSYNIGLAPKTPSPNNNNSGAGFMNGTGNTPTVPYQLRSTAGPSGTLWGNNGSTFASLTNGVTGMSNGSEQSHTVYVTVPSADFKPDNYSDTVTINVNY